jgi:hypothetical protein
MQIIFFHSFLFDILWFQVYVKGKGAVKISELEIGDSVLAASPQGTPSSSEVIFMHDHKETSATVQIFVADDMMELTPAHMVALHTETCGLRYCSDAQLVPAKQIRAGDKIYVSDGITTAVQVCGRVDQTVFRTRFHSYLDWLAADPSVSTSALPAHIRNGCADCDSCEQGRFQGALCYYFGRHHRRQRGCCSCLLHLSSRP